MLEDCSTNMSMHSSKSHLFTSKSNPTSHMWARRNVASFTSKFCSPHPSSSALFKRAKTWQTENVATKNRRIVFLWWHNTLARLSIATEWAMIWKASRLQRGQIRSFPENSLTFSLFPKKDTPEWLLRRWQVHIWWVGVFLFSVSNRMQTNRTEESIVSCNP